MVATFTNRRHFPHRLAFTTTLVVGQTLLALAAHGAAPAGPARQSAARPTFSPASATGDPRKAPSPAKPAKRSPTGSATAASSATAATSDTSASRAALPRACSFSVPVCVQITEGVPAWAAAEVFRAAESALSGYRALGLPMPLGDDRRGGTPAYDLYLGATTGPAVTVADPETEPRTTDQSAAYTLFPVPSTWGCDLSFEVARHIAEAIFLRADAGAEPGMLAAATSYLASIVAPCNAVEAPAVDLFQAEPHRAITELVANSAVSPASGNLLFPMYLEENGGSGDPGRLVTSLFAIATQKTEPTSLTWQNEPDTFDALRSSLRFRGDSLDTLLLGFAVDRAFVGNRSDGAHLWATDRYGAAGRVFFEWSVPYASLPRRLAPARPLDPTGATYLWLDLANAPKDAEITFVADWELPAVFRWSLVKVDKNGAESGRIDVAGMVGASHAERTVIFREELAGLIVVGTFTGPLDRTIPFDPDEAPFMPHSYEVTLYGRIDSTASPSVAPSD